VLVLKIARLNLKSYENDLLPPTLDFCLDITQAFLKRMAVPSTWLHCVPNFVLKVSTTSDFLKNNIIKRQCKMGIPIGGHKLLFYDYVDSNKDINS